MSVREQSYANGEVIFREGDASDYAYVILRGAVELSAIIDEGPITLTTLQVGSMFGEMGVITGGPRSATAHSVGPSLLRVSDREAFLQSLNENPASTMEVLHHLVARLRDTTTLMQTTQHAPNELTFSRFDRWPHWFKPLRRWFPDRRTRSREVLDVLPNWAAIEEREAPFLANATLYSLTLMIVLGVIWASVAKVDRIVIAQGKIVTTVPQIVVKSPETATIAHINVRPGQRVKKGDVLATLDRVSAEADEANVRSVLRASTARIHRLEAELKDKNFSDGNKTPELLLERTLFTDRHAEYLNQIKAFDSESRQYDSQLATIKNNIRSLAEQVAHFKELVQMRNTLLEKGSGSRLQWLEAQTRLLEVTREFDSTSRKPTEISQKLNEIKAKKDAYISEWHSKVSNELVDVTSKYNNSVETLKKAEQHVNLVDLTAPEDAVVLEMAARTPGAVVREADTFIVLVPTDVLNEIEINITPEDIGYVRTGDEVRVKIGAMPFQKHGTLSGRLSLIGANTISVDVGNDRKSMAYRSVVELFIDPLRTLRHVPPDFVLIPGMTVTAEIKVGRRTIMSYFLYPIIGTVDEGLREP